MLQFSIIIPVKAINDYLRETVSHVKKIEGTNWELIILPNVSDSDGWDDNRIREIESGRVGPAKKRDIGALHARGSILVFLDDDSYPEPDLLKIAEPYFENESTVALGGPAITPRSDSFWQKVSGAVFLSKFSGGAPERYVSIGDPREVDDWPSVNLMVRRDDFLSVGGFNSEFWPGEDTKFCLDLIKKTGKKIFYIPNMLVWHHRRSGILEHLRQIGGYGLHRGYFAKKYPETSRKMKYFMPSLFFLYTTFGFIIPVFWSGTREIFLVFGLIYSGALVRSWIDIKRYEGKAIAFSTVPYIVLTHLYYGLKFLQGYLTSDLRSRLR